jgi:hypothetical protein
MWFLALMLRCDPYEKCDDPYRKVTTYLIYRNHPSIFLAKDVNPEKVSHLAVHQDMPMDDVTIHYKG